MNRIRLGRLLIAGLITLLVFIAIEVLWEGVIGSALFSRIAEVYSRYYTVQGWTLPNHALNIGIALVNTIMMMWLYVALRPMFGVGTRTALITSGFVFAFVLAFAINNVNLGVLPRSVAAVDMVNLVIEMPLSIIVGTRFYESGDWSVPAD